MQEYYNNNNVCVLLLWTSVDCSCDVNVDDRIVFDAETDIDRTGNNIGINVIAGAGIEA